MTESLYRIDKDSALNQAQLVAYLIAATPTFQQLVVAADEQEARDKAFDIRLYTPTAFEDIYTSQPPPFVICSKSDTETGFEAQAENTFGGQGDIIVQFVIGWDQETPIDYFHRAFENATGKIMKEAGQISHERRPLFGYENEMTHIDLMSYRQTEAPCELDPAEFGIPDASAGRPQTYFQDEWRVTHRT